MAVQSASAGPLTSSVGSQTPSCKPSMISASFSPCRACGEPSCRICQSTGHLFGSSALPFAHFAVNAERYPGPLAAYVVESCLQPLQVHGGVLDNFDGQGLVGPYAYP